MGYLVDCRNNITLHTASLRTACTSEARLHLGDARTLGRILGIGWHMLQYIHCYVKRINAQIRVSTGRMSHIRFCLQSQQGFGEAGLIYGMNQLDLKEHLQNNLCGITSKFETRLVEPGRSLLLLLLMVAAGGVPIFENPNSTLLNAHNRFVQVVQLLKDKGIRLLAPTIRAIPGLVGVAWMLVF